MWDGVEQRSSTSCDECVTRGDLVRFAQVKALGGSRGGSVLPARVERAASPGLVNASLQRVAPFERQLAATLESEWAAFVQFCCDSDAVTRRGGGECSSGDLEARSGINDANTSERRSTVHVEALERFFAVRITHSALRNSSFVTEELLSLCIPTMTAMLEDEAAAALSRVTYLRHRIAHLQDESPWKEWLSTARLELNQHSAVCEQLLLDSGNASSGCYSERLDAARQRLVELEAAEADVHARLAVAAKSLEENELATAMSCLLVTESRLVQHLRCRALGATVMQHLPSFECSSTSDRDNDRFRPVQSALLFTAAELESRRLADEQRTHAAAAAARHRYGATVVPDADEVSVLQNLLRKAMRKTVVRRVDFDRIVSMVLSQ